MEMTNVSVFTVNDSEVVNASALVERLDFTPSWFAGINRVENPSGPNPGYGKFLIKRSDYDTNFPADDSFDIVIRRISNTSPTQTVTLKGYVHVSAFAALNKPDSPMVVTVADIRFLAHKQTVTEDFNLTDSTENTRQEIVDAIKPLIAPDGDLLTLPGHASEPKNLLYASRNAADVLWDHGVRSQHWLVFDPITGMLKFSKFDDDQAAEVAKVDAARVSRRFNAPPDFFRSMKAAEVFFDSADTFESIRIAIGDPLDEGLTTRRHWATRNASEPEADRQAEADSMKPLWDAWDAANQDIETLQLLGLHTVETGAIYSCVTWEIISNEAYTTVTKGRHPEPFLERQFVKAAGEFCPIGLPKNSSHCGTVASFSGTTAQIEVDGVPYPVEVKGGGVPPVGEEYGFHVSDESDLFTNCCSGGCAYPDICFPEIEGVTFDVASNEGTHVITATRDGTSEPAEVTAELSCDEIECKEITIPFVDGDLAIQVGNDPSCCSECPASPTSGVEPSFLGGAEFPSSTADFNNWIGSPPGAIPTVNWSGSNGAYVINQTAISSVVELRKFFFYDAAIHDGITVCAESEISVSLTPTGFSRHTNVIEVHFDLGLGVTFSCGIRHGQEGGLYAVSAIGSGTGGGVILPSLSQTSFKLRLDITSVETAPGIYQLTCESYYDGILLNTNQATATAPICEGYVRYVGENRVPTGPNMITFTALDRI